MMSQQSNDGFLAESELPEQILRYLDLKLDKDSFLKPTRETVTELYTRFLDKTGIEWRKGQKTIILSRMLSMLKMIFSHFNIDYEFSRTDIIAPTRKRTNTYLNVILYVLAMLEERLKNLQQWEAQYAAEQQEVDKINQEIARKRELRDELGFTIGQAKDSEQIRPEIEARERAFNDKKKDCDRLEELKCTIKEAIEEQRMIIEKIDKESQMADQRNNLSKQLEDLMQREAQLREKIDKDEIVGAKRRNEANLVLTQNSRELLTRQNEMGNRFRDCKSQMKELDIERANVAKEREALLAKRKQRDNENKELVARAKKKLEMLRVPRDNSKRASCDAYVSSHKERLEAHLGINRPMALSETQVVGFNKTISMLDAHGGFNKTMTMLENDRNSTYIKSKGPTN